MTNTTEREVSKDKTAQVRRLRDQIPEIGKIFTLTISIPDPELSCPNVYLLVSLSIFEMLKFVQLSAVHVKDEPVANKQKRSPGRAKLKKE